MPYYNPESNVFLELQVGNKCVGWRSYLKQISKPEKPNIPL